MHHKASMPKDVLIMQMLFCFFTDFHLLLILHLPHLMAKSRCHLQTHISVRDLLICDCVTSLCHFFAIIYIYGKFYKWKILPFSIRLSVHRHVLLQNKQSTVCGSAGRTGRLSRVQDAQI